MSSIDLSRIPGLADALAARLDMTRDDATPPETPAERAAEGIIRRSIAGDMEAAALIFEMIEGDVGDGSDDDSPE